MATSGEVLIAEERLRQIREEGWTAEHDDEHSDGAMAWAAICYAAPEPVYRMDLREEPVDPWPWSHQWDKRGDVSRIRDLVKAGALIAAEIDRLQRFADKEA